MNRGAAWWFVFVSIVFSFGMMFGMLVGAACSTDERDAQFDADTVQYHADREEWRKGLDEWKARNTDVTPPAPPEETK